MKAKEFRKGWLFLIVLSLIALIGSVWFYDPSLQIDIKAMITITISSLCLGRSLYKYFEKVKE